MISSSSTRPGSFWADFESWLHRHTGGWCFGWVYLLAIFAYLPTAASTVQEADAGQFLSLGATCLNSGWPIAHPPGYPVETAISCGAAWLSQLAPVVPASLWLAWASAICAALAAGLAFSAMTRIGLASPAQSLLTVAVVFLARDSWRVATTQEAHALGMLTLTGALLLPVLARHQGNHKLAKIMWALAGASFGLGFANHHTTAIALPGALWCLWQAGREARHEEGSGKPIRRGLTANAVFFAAGSLAGALPVLVVVYRTLYPQDFMATTAAAPVPAFDWVSASSSPLRYLLRADFGTFSLAPGKVADARTALGGLRAFARDLPANTGWFWIVATLHGAFMIRRRKSCAVPFAAAAVTAVVFLGLMRVDPDSETIDVVRRFHPFILITMMPLMAAGIADLAQRVRHRVLTGIMTALVAAQVFMTLPVARRDHHTFPEEHFKSALEMLPPGSLVVAASDQEIFGLSYAQVTLGIRPDVRVLNLLEWGAPEKRARVLARVGIDPASMITLNRGELIGMIATREPAWIIDAPMPPRPAYLAKSPCVGPFLVLDLRAKPEIRENRPVQPQTTSRPWFMTDQSLLEKYESCVE